MRWLLASFAIATACWLSLTPAAFAQTAPVASPPPVTVIPLDAPNLSVPIPGLTFSKPLIANGVLTSNLLGEYVAGFYKYLLSIAIVIAIVFIMIGGLQYVLAAGSGDVSKAKTRILNAITGLVLLLGSYVILYTVNPNLTGFQTLQITAIPHISSESRAYANTPPAEGGKIDQYKAMGCPTTQELENGVTFYITSYYAPAYGDTGFEGISFECNIAMQCSCPQGGGTKADPQTCYSKGLDLHWSPCTPFDSSVPFCDQTTAYKSGLVTTPPRARITAAVSSCLPLGTVFKVFGAPDAASNTAIWSAEDTGGAIKGRRVDLFMGTGSSAYQTAITNYGEVTIRTCPDNDSTKCPSSP